MTIDLTNDYHGTSTRVRPHHDKQGYYLTAYQRRRARARLCGSDSCTCSGAWGTRGEQPDNDGWTITGASWRWTDGERWPVEQVERGAVGINNPLPGGSIMDKRRNVTIQLERTPGTGARPHWWAVTAWDQDDPRRGMHAHLDSVLADTRADALRIAVRAASFAYNVLGAAPRA